MNVKAVDNANPLFGTTTTNPEEGASFITNSTVEYELWPSESVAAKWKLYKFPSERALSLTITRSLSTTVPRRVPVILKGASTSLLSAVHVVDTARGDSTVAEIPRNPASLLYLGSKLSIERAGGDPATTSMVVIVVLLRKPFETERQNVYTPTSRELAATKTLLDDVKLRPQLPPVISLQDQKYANGIVDSSGSLLAIPSRLKEVSRPICRKAPPAIMATRSCSPTSTETEAVLFTLGVSVMNPTTRKVYEDRAASDPAGTTRTRGFFEVPDSCPVNVPDTSLHRNDIFAFAKFDETQSIAGSVALATRVTDLLCVAARGLLPWILITGAGILSFSISRLAEWDSPRKLVTLRVTVK